MTTIQPDSGKETKNSGIRDQSSSGSPRLVFIRAALIALWIGIGVVLFIFNRGHALLVDNRNLQDEGIRAPGLVTVYVDNQNGLEFLRGDRDRFQVAGSNHRIYIEFDDGMPPLEKTFTLPIKDDMYILSIPKMISGIEPFVEVFHSAQVNREEAAAARSAEEAGEGEDAGIFGSVQDLLP
jgi:hypothetical protein